MKRLSAILLCVSAGVLAQSKGEIDWSRRVLIGHGQGAPDLKAPSLAVARLGAERAAKLDAYRNALETLQGLAVQTGGTVGALLRNDARLASRTDGLLKGVQPIKTHYYSDGGVSLDIEVPLDQLPEELARAVPVPDGIAPLRGVRGEGGVQQGAVVRGPDMPGPDNRAPEMRGDTMVQEARGEAAVLGGDRAAAREKATQDALRRAVEMAAGARVQSRTEVENFQMKMDQVLSHSSGFVRRYDIVSEGMDGDALTVTVRAEIGTAELDKDLAAMGMLMARKGMPRTMVLIAEQNIGMASPRGAWMGAVSADLRIAENVVLDQLRQGGFGQLIDPEIATEKAATVGGITTEITAGQARKLRSLTGAEVIIVAQAIATGRGDVGELGPGWKSCTASMSGRAVNTDTGDILATAETTQNAAQLDELTCGKEAIKKASRAFAQEMIRKVAERFTQDVSGGNAIHLVARNVNSFKLASDFRRALSEQIRGVQGVAERSFGGGRQELDVTLRGTTQDLAGELEAKKLGAFSVRVTGVTANTIDVELSQ